MTKIALRTTRWHEYDSHVQSFTTITLWVNGNWELHTKFSNGSKMEKQSMSAATRVFTPQHIFTKKGQYLFGGVHEVNLDPSFGGSANEYVSVSTGKIDPKLVRRKHAFGGYAYAWTMDFTASKVTSAALKKFFKENPYTKS